MFEPPTVVLLVRTQTCELLLDRRLLVCELLHRLLQSRSLLRPQRCRRDGAPEVLSAGSKLSRDGIDQRRAIHLHGRHRLLNLRVDSLDLRAVDLHALAVCIRLVLPQALLVNGIRRRQANSPR